MFIDNINTQITSISIFLITCIYILYTNSFFNDIPTCNGYVTNVYIYILLGVILNILSVLFISKRNFPITGKKSIIAFIIGIIALISLQSIEPNNILLNHILWSIFIISISTCIYVSWRYTKYKNTINLSSKLVIFMILGLIFISIYKPELINSSFSNSLFTFIIISILSVYIGNKNNTRQNDKLLSIILVFSFMSIIIYNTAKLKINSEICTFPNYPKESISLFFNI